ncbi:restriction endonuclease subunit S, partial [Treponema sp.]|uniref:restriction endonuclease subunit S n=1 Tax=Treponema sp. TaxID=166 RepID=UPI0025D36E06
MNDWKMVKLGDVCEKGSSNIAQNEIADNNGEYPIYGAAGFIKNVDFYKQDKPYIGIVKDGAGVGRVSVHPAKSSLIGTMQYIFPKENIDIKFLAEFLKYQNLSRFYTGATIPHIYFKDYQNIPLKLPSLQKQKHISAVLDKCSALIAKYKLMLEKYDTLIKSRFIEMFGDPVINEKNWEKVRLDSVADIKIGPFGSLLHKEDYITGGHALVNPSHIIDG